MINGPVNETIWITAGNRLLQYNFNSNEAEQIFQDNRCKWLMGITKVEDGLVVSGDNGLFNLGNNCEIVFNNVVPSPNFHHTKYINNNIIMTCTQLNQLVIFNEDMDFIQEVNITPPNECEEALKILNYNHINGICFYGDKYYVDLNWLTNRQFDVSGVAVLDKEFNEIDRFEYGWQTHGFTIIDNNCYALCGTNKTQPQVHHPNIGGLMVNGDIVYEISSDWFCKDFSIDDNYIYIVGGNNSFRAERNKTNGILIILDRKFNKITELIFEGTGEFKGCLLQYDYCDGTL